MSSKVDLVLFDIDGTLLKGNSAHRRSFQYGFDTIYGLGPSNPDFVNKIRVSSVNAPPECASLDDLENHAGGVDVPLIALVCRAHGLDDDLIWQKMPYMICAMEKFMEREFSNGSCGGLHALDGVSGVLKGLEKAGVPVGLVTGNLEKAGHMKLRAIGLNGHFEFGGFGTDLTRKDVTFDFFKDRSSLIFKAVGKYIAAANRRDLSEISDQGS